MRYRAAKELKYKEVPVIVMAGLTEDQEREIAIKDNGSFGEWDYEALANEWGDLPLAEWGVEIPAEWISEAGGDAEHAKDDTYTNKIVAPIYEPKGEQPPLSALIDRSKTDNLIASIDSAGIPDEIAGFLRQAAERHTVFNFRQIAEYYCHADATVQDLMERSGLVIIDFNKAIEYGFVHLTERLGKLADLEEEDNNA